MIDYLKGFTDDAFGEYQVTKKVIGSHPGWHGDMVSSAVESLKIRYDKKYHTNLMTAVNQTVEEVENFIRSLDETIKRWKIKNLD
jgi:hypothetical protein